LVLDLDIKVLIKDSDLCDKFSLTYQRPMTNLFDLSKTGIFMVSILVDSYQRQGFLWWTFFRLINLNRGIL